MPCHFVATQTSLDGTWLLLTQECYSAGSNRVSYCCCSNQFWSELGPQSVVNSLDVSVQFLRAQGFHTMDAGLSMLVSCSARAQL